MNDTYFVNTVKGKRGPFTLENLKQFVERGSVKESTAVSVGDTEIWVKAKTIPGLFPENDVLEEIPESVSLPDNSVPGVSNSSPMFCCYCGKPTPGGAAFCPSCGKPTTGTIHAPTKLKKSKPKTSSSASKRSGADDWDDVDFDGFAKNLMNDYKEGLDEEYFTMSEKDFESKVIGIKQAAMLSGDGKQIDQFITLGEKLRKLFEERFRKKPRF